MTDVSSESAAGYGPEPPRVRWPGGALVAISLVISYEGGDRYGARSGIWRLCRLIDRYSIPVTMAACGRELARNPPLAGWLRDHDHDLLGRYEPGMGTGLTREQERAELRTGVSYSEQATGRRPRGWLAYYAQSRELLADEGGFWYASGPADDELPYYMTDQGRAFLIVPGLHDDRQPVAARHFGEGLQLSLDYLLEEARSGPGGRMMSVEVRAGHSGQPGPAAALCGFIEYAQAQPEVTFMRRADLARFWLDTFPASA
jgi:peptidoglycan/xylan/chitin deacetylase (PgdA/CDA1 family)